MNAKDIMTLNVVTVSPTDPVKKVMQVLVYNKVSGVPVIDEKKKVLGIITEYDLILGIATVGPGHDVHQIMQKNFTSITPMTEIEEITNLVIAKRFKSFPVIDDDGKLVGIVSRRDIMSELYSGD